MSLNKGKHKGQLFNVKVEKKRDENGDLVAYVWDSSETFLPDFTPDWLYDILEAIEASSGGYYDEDMESVFSMDDKFYQALITHSQCAGHEEVDSSEDAENEDD